MHPFETVGIESRLGLALVGVVGSLLRLDDGERLAVVVPEDVIGGTLARGRRLVIDLDLLADIFGAGAVGPDVPTDRGQLKVNQPPARALLVEVQFSDGGSAARFHLLLELCGLGIGDLTCFAFRLQLLEERVKAGLVGGELLQGVALFPLQATFGLVRRWLYRGGLIRRKLVDRAAALAHEQPAGDVEEFLQKRTGGRRFRRLAVRRLVSLNANGMQLVEDNARDDFLKFTAVKQLDEVGPRQILKLEEFVETQRHLLGEDAHFGHGALRVRVDVGFRERTNLGQLRPRSAQELEVYRFHDRLAHAPR